MGPRDTVGGGLAHGRDQSRGGRRRRGTQDSRGTRSDEGGSGLGGAWGEVSSSQRRDGGETGSSLSGREVGVRGGEGTGSVRPSVTSDRSIEGLSTSEVGVEGLPEEPRVTVTPYTMQDPPHDNNT